MDAGSPDRTDDILAGFTVLDLSRDLSGPYTSMMLAELGAEVVEVEHPAGDETRSWPPIDGEFSGYFATINRSKRGVAIDLKQPEGLAIVHDLARDADVVMQSFAPGVADRLGLGYEAIKDLNPDVIYYSLSGFGQDGPWRTRRGYDPILQAMSGHMSVMGEKGRGPVKSMVPIADLSAAVHGTAAILGALLRRERTARGQHIDMAMLDVMVSMLSVVGTRFLLTGEVPHREGTQNPARVPSAAFECADGSYLQVVPNQRQWPDFCRLLGHDGWTSDPRFATPSARVEHADTLYPLVRRAMRARTAAAWERLFAQVNVACSPIFDLAEVFDLEQVRHRELAVAFTDSAGTPRRGLALPFRYSETPSRVRSRPPRLGEHTVEVLRGVGRTQEEIDALIRSGVVRAADPRATEVRS